MFKIYFLVNFKKTERVLYYKAAKMCKTLNTLKLTLVLTKYCINKNFY